MGQWIKRRANEHQHDMPVSLDTKAAVGDTWRCNCGQVFEVVSLNVHRAYDQRENDYQTAEWEKILGQKDV